MTAPALGPASSLASAAVDTAPAAGVLGCPSCDGIRLHPTACIADAGIERCPGGAGAGRAPRPAGRVALPGLRPDSTLESWTNSGQLRPARASWRRGRRRRRGAAGGVPAGAGGRCAGPASGGRWRLSRRGAAGSDRRCRPGGGQAFGRRTGRSPTTTPGAAGSCQRSRLAAHHGLPSPSTLRSSPGCRWLSSPLWPT